MIFNEGYGSDTNLDNVKPSPYELGLEGALMHVYENECNYNAIIKSVGLAEMKYYAETGKDLFLNEAGAIGGFFAKVKAFFKKVIEKIQAIFKKFVMVMNQYAMSDKQFANKYEKEVIRASLKDFEFKGYKFGNLSGMTDISKVIDIGEYEKLTKKIADMSDRLTNSITTLYNNIDYADERTGKPYRNYTSDDVNDDIGYTRGKLVGKNNSNLDESEFRDELKDLFYGNDGEKEILDEKDINKREIITQLKDNRKNIKAAEDTRKKIEKAIKNMISELEKIEKGLSKSFDDDNHHTGAMKDKKTGKDIPFGEIRNDGLKVVQNLIRVEEGGSNAVTIMFGMLVQALKDRARQNKAICVKLVGRKVKDESYSYGYGSYDDSIFSDVVIR